MSAHAPIGPPEDVDDADDASVDELETSVDVVVTVVLVVEPFDDVVPPPPPPPVVDVPSSHPEAPAATVRRTTAVIPRDTVMTTFEDRIFIKAP